MLSKFDEIRVLLVDDFTRFFLTGDVYWMDKNLVRVEESPRDLSRLLYKWSYQALAS